MKQLIAILVLVALASTPALATVTITQSVAGTTGTIGYTSATPQTADNTVRAFALDIAVNNSQTITAVTCNTASGYYIYPGSIVITSGSVVSYGGCVCDATKYAGTQGGATLPQAAVTVEMGSLYTGSAKPASSGTLLTFTVSATPCTATVTTNTARGGVVMENPDSTELLATPLPTLVFGSTDCLTLGRVFSGVGISTLTVTQAMIDKWNTLGKPNCWCCDAQKRGNGVYTPTSTAQKTDIQDVAKMKNSAQWNQSFGSAGYNANPCSDTNLSGKIDITDVARVKNTANWNQIVGAGSGCQ